MVYFRAVVKSPKNRSKSPNAAAAPDVCHVAATVHATKGLLKLEIRRLDLVGDNAYETLLGFQYDGWPG